MVSNVNTAEHRARDRDRCIFLPGELRGDLAGRLILTSARHLGVPVVTRDPRIIAYGRDGHVQVIPC